MVLLATKDVIWARDSVQVAIYSIPPPISVLAGQLAYQEWLCEYASDVTFP